MKPVNRPENKQTESQEARRKIIKGIAGLPAVYTLSSGARAATASALDCLANPPTPPDPNTLNTATPPQRVRSCVDPADAEQYPLNPDVYFTEPDKAARLINTLPGQTPASGKDQACVIYVDDDGNFITFDQGTAGTTPAYASCYASIVVSDQI